MNRTGTGKIWIVILFLGISIPTPAIAQTIFTTEDFRQDREHWTRVLLELVRRRQKNLGREELELLLSSLPVIKADDEKDAKAKHALDELDAASGSGTLNVVDAIRLTQRFLGSSHQSSPGEVLRRYLPAWLLDSCGET